MIYNVDLSSEFCIRLAISKGLGLGIVAGGSIMKLPQILKIISNRSARGISLSMYVLEVIAYTISLAYAVRAKLPFSTYGENASLTVQNIVIMLLVIAYGSGGAASTPTSRGGAIRTNSKAPQLALATILTGVGCLALASPSIIPPHALQVLQALTIPISLASKVPQIVELHRAKASGQLSAFAVFAQLAGCMARVYTTVTETNDRLLFWGFTLATLFNLVIAGQVSLFPAFFDSFGYQPDAQRCSSPLPSALSLLSSSLSPFQVIAYWNEPGAKAKGKNSSSEEFWTNAAGEKDGGPTRITVSGGAPRRASGRKLD